MNSAQTTTMLQALAQALEQTKKDSTQEDYKTNLVVTLALKAPAKKACAYLIALGLSFWLLVVLERMAHTCNVILPCIK